MKTTKIITLFMLMPLLTAAQKKYTVQWEFTQMIKSALGIEAGYRIKPGLEITVATAIRFYRLPQNQPGIYETEYLENTVTVIGGNNRLLKHNFTEGKPFDDYGSFKPATSLQFSTGLRRNLFREKHTVFFIQPMLDGYFHKGWNVSTSRTLVSSTESTCCADNAPAAQDVTILQQHWFEKRTLSKNTWDYSLGLSAAFGYRIYLSKVFSLEFRGITGTNFLYPDSRINFAAFDRYYYRFSGLVGFRF